MVAARRGVGHVGNEPDGRREHKHLARAAAVLPVAKHGRSREACRGKGCVGRAHGACVAMQAQHERRQHKAAVCVTKQHGGEGERQRGGAQARAKQALALSLCARIRLALGARQAGVTVLEPNGSVHARATGTRVSVAAPGAQGRVWGAWCGTSTALQTRGPPAVVRLLPAARRARVVLALHR